MVTNSKEEIAYFIHNLKCMVKNSIAAGTRIWAYAHILSGAKIGSDVNVFDHTFIENYVFIEPNAAFTNDFYPRSKQYPIEFLKTIIRRESSVGANATVLPNTIISENSMIGAGAVVIRRYATKYVSN